MVKHTQTYRRKTADKLIENVWPFCEIGAKKVNFDDWYSPLSTAAFFTVGKSRTLPNLLNVIAKGSISDVWRGVELASAIYFMVILSDPEKVFKRCSLFENLNQKQGTLINFKTSFFFCGTPPDGYFYLPLFLFVLLLLRIGVCVLIKKVIYKLRRA